MTKLDRGDITNRTPEIFFRNVVNHKSELLPVFVRPRPFSHSLSSSLISFFPQKFIIYGLCHSTSPLLPLIPNPFIQNSDGVNFIYLKSRGLYFLLTSLSNVSPSLSFEVLNRITKLIKDYCGILSEDSIRTNFVLIYEILDEIMV